MGVQLKVGGVYGRRASERHKPSKPLEAISEQDSTSWSLGYRFREPEHGLMYLADGRCYTTGESPLDLVVCLSDSQEPVQVTETPEAPRLTQETLPFEPTSDASLARDLIDLIDLLDQRVDELSDEIDRLNGLVARRNALYHAIDALRTIYPAEVQV
jgi:hypothetical protein